MRIGKLFVYLSSVLFLFISISQSYAQPHQHGGRSHTHGLPAQGIGHRHNNGIAGKPFKNTRVTSGSIRNSKTNRKYSQGNRIAALKTKSRRILNNFSLPRRCSWPDVPVFRKRSEVSNFKYEKAKPYIRCLEQADKYDFDDLEDLVKDLGGTWREKGTQIFWKVPRYCECKQEVKNWFSKIKKRDASRIKKGNRFVRLLNKRISDDGDAIRYQESNPNWRKRPKRPLGNGPKRIIIPSSPTYRTPGYY